jgi:hypothetical protein
MPPFELTIDKSKWETYRNRDPVRVQSQPKQVEIDKQVQEMLANGIIEKSQAIYYSQVMLTPKPDGSYRFCADYHNMNDATPDASWPIRNIAQLLTTRKCSWGDGPHLGLSPGPTTPRNKGTHRIHNVRLCIPIHTTSVRTQTGPFVLPGTNGI